MSDEKELINAKEAIAYLCERWNIESYSETAFRSLRFRRGIKPALSGPTATYYRKSDLDQIPKPDKSSGKGKKKEEKSGEEGPPSSSVARISFSDLEAIGA